MFLQSDILVSLFLSRQFWQVYLILKCGITLFDYIIAYISTPEAARISPMNKSFELVPILVRCLSEAGGVGVLVYTLWSAAIEGMTCITTSCG